PHYVSPLPPSPFPCSSPLHHPHLHSFPTRRSSDLVRLRCHPAHRVVENLRVLRILSEEFPDRHSKSMIKSDAARLHARKQLAPRSEEHTSELQSRGHLVCRLLLEKKKKNKKK